MKQKLRILTLSFLLIMQSFFGLTPITLAEESGENVVETEVVDDSGSEETVVEEEEATVGNEPEVDEENGSPESDNDEEVTKEDEPEAGEGTEETEIPTGEPVSPPENGLIGGQNVGVGMMSTIPAAEFGNDVTFNFERLVINNTVTIRNEQDAQNYQPKLGETVNIYYTFDIKATQDYGPGSSFTFQLPQALLAFESSTLSGSIDHGDIQLAYTTTDGIVTVTMEEGELFETQELEDGQLHFTAKFDEVGSNGELEQTLVIPIGGSQTVQLPFTFKPPTSNAPMTKTGSSAILADGTRVINWEVWVNRKGENLNGAQVNDQTDGNHQLRGNITVAKYKVGLNGVASSPTETSSTDTSFPVNLADGHFAYKLTYQTVVTAEATTEEVTYENTATLNGSHSDSVKGSAKHKYGTKLEKKATNSNKYNASWEIEYNYFGKKFSTTQSLVDTITGPHKIIPSSVKVYPVTFDVQGNPTVSTTETTPVSGPDITNGGKTLTIGLNSQNGQAYYITYETEHEKDFVTGNSRVDNEVTYTDYDGGSKTDGFSISEGIFSKSGGTPDTIDYAKKEITWTLHVNAERAMNNLVITDTFTSYTQGGTRQTLINPDGTAVDSNNVAAAFTISNSNVSINNATLQNNEREGVRLELGNIPQGRNFTITYKTKFDLQANGAAYPGYENIARADWIHPTTSEPFFIKDKKASYTPGNSPTGKNGYKEGSFDHVNQRFNWKLAVNINKQDISGAELVDTIGDGHELVTDSINVYKLSLDLNQEKGTYDENSPILASPTTYTLTPSSKGFTLTFSNSLADNNEAYIITYQTKDENAIIGHAGGASYGNEATFTTLSGGEFEFDATAEVKYANELIKKSVATNPSEETITWTIDVNRSHSALGNIVLTDKMSANQLILPDTFEKREITMNAAGTISYGNWQPATPTINSTENSFTLDLGDLTKKGYQIRYKTFFLGVDGETFSNEASINYAGATTEATNEARIDNRQFFYSASSGTISSTKGTLEIQKVGVNPLTGEQENLAGITFHLKNLSGTIKLAEATTDAAGKLTFENVRYGKYKLEEIGTPTGYNPLNPNPLDITMDDKIDGKTYVVENIKNVDMSSACEYFTLTLNDVDSEARQSVQVKLVNKNTGASVTRSTDGNGQISIVRTQLPAGPYEAYEVINGQEEQLDDVIVSYDGNCDAKVIQPKPTCSEFTITIADTNNNPRAHVAVTLKHKTDSNAPEISATTGADGTFTVPSTTEAGLYKVYDGKQYLGEVTVTYKGGCEATVTEVPKCEVFTLTVNDIDGNPRNEGVAIVVKEKGTDTVVATKTTDVDGKIVLEDLKPGEYEVYEDDASEPFAEFASNTSCSADVQPAPPCEDFTITVNDVDGVHREGVTITIKDKDGKEVASKTTDKNGQVTIPTSDLPAGEYEVYEGVEKLADLTVSYKDGCQTVVIQPEPKCDFFTIKNRDLEVGTEVILKDADGIEKNTTVTKAGEVQFASNDLPAGKYEVIIAGELLDNITVSYKNKCSTTIHQLDFEEDGKKTFLEEIITKQQCTPQVQPIKDGKAIGEKRPINKNGVFTTEEGEHEFAVTIECEGEEEIVVGKITVDEDGKVKEELIDPYGTITVCVTNEVLGGVEVELYYADTQRNRDNGRTPGTLANLPELSNFGPNFNANPQVSKYDPQWSDVAGDYATYAWMVYPEADYYIVAKKQGYVSETSNTISVEYDIVKHDFCMKPYSSSGGGGGGGSTPPSSGGSGGGGGGSTPPSSGGSGGGGGGSTPPTNPEKPEKPVDPTKPVDPENPEQPIEQEKPIDPNNPTDPTNPNQPGSPSENGNPVDSDKLGQVGSNGANNHSQNALGASDGKDPSAKNGKKLPQTGEETNLVLLFGGIISIMIGASLIIFRRKTKAL